MSMIPGYKGNFWVEGNNLSYPFEIEMYGCEDYNLEKGESNFFKYLSCHDILIFHSSSNDF